MGNNRSSLFMRVLVFIGLFLFAGNSVLFYFEHLSSPLFILNITALALQSIIGVIIIIYVLRNTRKGYQIFVGMILAGWGILGLFVTTVLPHRHLYWWTLYLISASLFLLFSGLIKYRKLKFGYVIPSFTLLCMGIWFSLFSFGILKIPFKTVAFVLGPSFIVLVGVILIVFFFVQQRHKNLVIKDEDSGDFADEEIAFPKLD